LTDESLFVHCKVIAAAWCGVPLNDEKFADYKIITVSKIVEVS